MTVTNTSFFFDRAGMAKAIDKEKAAHLRAYGAWARKVIRNSMKKKPDPKSKRFKRLTQHGRYLTIKSGKRKGQQRFEKGKVSSPGSPPFYSANYTGINLRDITFQHNGTADEVVLATKGKPGSKFTRGVPLLHEEGGTGKVLVPGRGGTLQPRTASYPARPYMQPGGEKALKTLRRKFEVK